MDIKNAWDKLFRLSSGNEWRRIPDDIRSILGLDSRLGICGGILCTQQSAIGINQLINKLNSIGGK